MEPVPDATTLVKLMENLSKEKPIFLIGAERSGTTLLEVMLGCHPRITAPPPAWLFPRFYPYLYTYGDLSQDDNLRTLASEMLLSVHRWRPLSSNLTEAVDILVSEATEKSFAGLFNAMLKLHVKQTTKQRWVEKTPHNLFFIAPIKELFPNAQFLHIIRDGRDQSVSYMQASFGPTNVLVAAEAWKLCVNAVRPWKDKLSSSELLEISYEELVREPEKTLVKICVFLSEDYSPSMLDFWKRGIGRRRSKRHDLRLIGSPVTTESVGRYKRFLSIWEQEIFAGVAGKALEENGYAVDVEPRLLDEEEKVILREKDEIIRAALMIASGQHLRKASYSDWLVEQREARRQRGLWKESDASEEFPIGFPNEDFITGLHASRRMRELFGMNQSPGL